jgi:hydrogenase large subunit
MNSIGSADLNTFNEPAFPKGEIRIVGFHQAPRDAGDQQASYEAELLDNPVTDPENPLEVLRTVHSFYSCVACSICMVDTEQKEIVKVKTL